jgi:hypothetical protein
LGQNWLEKHGNAYFQDFWVAPELDGPLSNRQERLSDGLHRQDQISSKHDALATLCEPKHHLKFQKGDGEDMAWKHKVSELPAADLKMRNTMVELAEHLARVKKAIAFVMAKRS